MLSFARRDDFTGVESGDKAFRGAHMLAEVTVVVYGLGNKGEACI